SAAPCVTPCAAARPSNRMITMSTTFIHLGGWPTAPLPTPPPWTGFGVRRRSSIAVLFAVLVAQEPLHFRDEVVAGRHLGGVLCVRLTFELLDGRTDVGIGPHGFTDPFFVHAGPLFELGEIDVHADDRTDPAQQCNGRCRERPALQVVRHPAP